MSGKVTMGDNFYAPDELTVAVGATVTWEIVSGDAKHDVVAADGSFRSNSPMNRGETFSYTFTKAGEYLYTCSFHTVEHMVGKVIVK
jgi:plastocyanin